MEKGSGASSGFLGGWAASSIKWLYSASVSVTLPGSEAALVCLVPRRKAKERSSMQTAKPHFCASSHTSLFVTLKAEFCGRKLVLAGQFGNQEHGRAKRGKGNVDWQNAGYLASCRFRP